jgi:hypothetical protein
MLFGQARTATVVSVTTAELSVLCKPDFISIVKRFEECAPVFEENISRYAIVSIQVVNACSCRVVLSWNIR